MNNKKINIQENSKGAALIWAIFAIMIVAIFLGTIHTLLMSYVDRSVLSRDNRQAYLTARSVCNTLAEAIIEQTDTGFNSAITSMNIGDKIEIKDVIFQLNNEVEESHLNPTGVMPEAKGSIIKESEDTLKVVGEAKVGKGEKSVGAILKAKPKGGDTLYIRGGIQIDWPILHTGENTDMVVESDLTGIGKKFQDEHGWNYQEYILRIEDGDLRVKGNVKIIRTLGNSSTPGFINGKVIADGDITLQNVNIGRMENKDEVALYTPGNITLETTQNLAEGTHTKLQLEMKIYGDIVCNKLDIKIDTDKLAEGNEQLILYGDIQTEQGVYINDKPLSFEDKKPSGDVYWAGDFTPQNRKKLVIMGEERSDIKVENIKKPVIPTEPHWVKNIPSDPKEITLGWNIQDVLRGGEYYVLKPTQQEVNIDSAHFENVTPDSPVTIIIPSNTKVIFNNHIGGVNEVGKVSDGRIYTWNANKEEYKEYNPRVRFIIEENAELQILGDSYVHIYGKANAQLVMKSNALIGSLSVEKLNTAGENNKGGNISYHALGNAEATGVNGSYEIEKYINP